MNLPVRPRPLFLLYGVFFFFFLPFFSSYVRTCSSHTGVMIVLFLYVVYFLDPNLTLFAFGSVSIFICS